MLCGPLVVKSWGGPPGSIETRRVRRSAISQARERDICEAAGAIIFASRARAGGNYPGLFPLVNISLLNTWLILRGT